MMDKEEGSILLSTFHLLLFSSFLIISLTTVMRYQIMQLQQISHSYEAKALIELSADILRERVETDEIETSTLYFNSGSVKINKETASQYTLIATLTNTYTSKATINIVPLEPTDVIEDSTMEETSDQEDVTDKEHRYLEVIHAIHRIEMIETVVFSE